MYGGLTYAQRHHLKVIVESKPEVLSVTLCGTLVDLGLVRPDGERFSATEEGATLRVYSSNANPCLATAAQLSNVAGA
jgi:hypothetical protein